MPYVRIWVHIVWSTKKRNPILNDKVRPVLFSHIRENASLKGIFLNEINGYTDHVHCLISLKNTQSISQVAQLIKGESARWLNQQNLIPEKLQWQRQYYAVSVGESGLGRVRKYIQSQEAHHQKQNFNQEIRVMIKKYGLKKCE